MLLVKSQFFLPATKVSEKTQAVGQFIIPKVKNASLAAYETISQSPLDENSSDLINEILSASSGALLGISTVYSGLSKATKIIAKNLTTNAVKLVEHK